MPGVSGFSAWLAAGALACAAPALGAAQFLPIAHSAQVTVEGRMAFAGLTLRARPTIPGAALNVTELSVTLDGVSEPAGRQPDGSWFVPLAASATAGGGKLDVLVSHDGIREVLSGRIASPGGGGAGADAGGAGAGGAHGVLRDHKQMAWWVLNIAVVLIAAIAISRRMS